MTIAANRKSRSTKALLAAIAVSAMALGLGSNALAIGGGGSSPSQSTPRYDPAQEHQSGVEALNEARYDDAITHFKRVNKASRRDANGNYLLGIAYMRSGDARSARKPLENAVKYGPDLLIAQRDLAIVYVQLDRADDAGEILTDLQQRQAACGADCAGKAELDAIVVEVEQAIAGTQLGELGPSAALLAQASQADARYVDAVGLINEGNYEQALISLQDARLALGPHPDILTYQGFANRKLGRFSVAEAYYQSALEVAPDHLGALEYYGELKVERGDLDGARAHLARLEQLCAFGCHEAEELRKWIANRSS